MKRPSASASCLGENRGSFLRRTRSRKPQLLLGLAALLFVLTVAASAQASLGIVGYFEIERCSGIFCSAEEPGQAANTIASAVNGDGSGGASPGDVYLLDSGSGIDRGRVQQVSAADEVVRLWGQGVVKNGPDNANETQAIAVDASAGTFRIGFGIEMTGDLAAEASAAQVQSALNGLASIGSGGVTVSGGPGNAGATSPYLISFDGGSLAGVDQPQLKIVDGSVPLGGGAGMASAYTTRIGGSGFEVCRPASGDECTSAKGNFFGNVLAGHLPSPRDIALDQVSGDIYIANARRIEVYSATGQFLRAWGQDVVASGPNDSTNNEKDTVTVAANANGGTFTLGFRPDRNFARENTASIPYDASPETVEASLNALARIGGNYSFVTVAGEGPVGAPNPPGSPYTITFHGLLGGDDLEEPLSANPNRLLISSGTKSVEIDNLAIGGGFEICNLDDACEEGAQGPGTDAAGAFREGPPSIAVTPEGAPNAGNLIVADNSNQRVQEFTPEGSFVRAFGWDVNETEPGTGFEVCAGGDTCKAGIPGSGLGQFQFLSAAVSDSDGDIYTVEDSNASGNGNNRVQKFVSTGGLDLAPASFGTSEVQALTVNAGAGKFYLTFGAEYEGVRGTGILTKGSPVITGVNTTSGAFAVGQPIRSNFGFRSYIVAVGADTITIADPAAFSSSNNSPENLISNLPYSTADLPYNASPGEVQSSLNALPSISRDGGSVSVSGGPGDPTGSSSYLISFDGGLLARTDPPQIAVSEGAVPLSGGTGQGANRAEVATTTPGGPGGSIPHASPFEVDAPFDIAIGPSDRVFVARSFSGNHVKCEDGAPSPYETRIQEFNSSGEVVQTSDPCSGIRGLEQNQSSPDLALNPSTGSPYLVGIHSNARDSVRLDVFGPPGPPPTLSLEPVADISAKGGTVTGRIDPSGPGTIYPDTTGTPSVARTTYRVEYRKASELSWTNYTPNIPIGSGTGLLPFEVSIAGLTPKTEYLVRVVATKPFTASVEETKSFSTLPAGPEVEALTSSAITAASADLNAVINPRGTATSYHFEYGTTPAYGNSTPERDIGESHAGQSVFDHVEGLRDTVYHFRVVATNSNGTVASADQTFNFHPQVCPNQTVRQQTGAAYLPDCRAYELVSPEDAGGTTLFTGGPQSPYATNPPRLAFVGQLATIPNSGRNPINTAGDLYVATRGAEGWRTRYIGPSAEEAGCVGGRPIISSTGYPTTIQNDVMADPGLNRILNWNLGNPMKCATGSQGGTELFDFNTAALGSNAPYVWNANGDLLERWPTSVADVPGSEANLSCPQDPASHQYPPEAGHTIPVSYFCSTYIDASKDLSHFVFSTQSGLFGEGITAAPGSAYDNNTRSNTLTLISKLPGGGPISQEPGGKAGAEELIQFPSVSADGSHILMGTATKPACRQARFPSVGDPPLCPIITQPTHLYMRVDNAVTYDVSAGKPVRYIGSTPDGTKVYFTSDEQLTGDDNDESVDLFMWSENGATPQLVRVSKGSSSAAGDTDSCASTWTTDCDVKTYDDSRISTVEGNRGGLGSWDPTNPNPGYTDNAIAAGSGDIYFYSPEQLVPGKGIPGKENLYVYREGSVRLVAPLSEGLYCFGSESGVFRPVCSNASVGRLQVTPDGKFAAFVTTSQVTAYDNQGVAEMYRYNAETEQIICVSCRPDGSAPEHDVVASEGGRFITDDGRTFFNTPEPLDPRDTNAGQESEGAIAGYDVYEFVDGRPQLISSGTGTGSMGGQSSANSVPGLYGVSADGVDVYFGTFDTLVGQDQNGAQLKFYDARTNGGFSFVPPPQPCAAADECHGPTAPVPAPLANGTGTSLTGGNATETSKKPRQRTGRHRKQKKRAQRKKAKAAAKAKRAAQWQKGGPR